MVTFFIALAVLIIGYVVYGKIIDKLFGADPKRETPAITMADGVDYVPMKPWRIFLIQFLNIAGVLTNTTPTKTIRITRNIRMNCFTPLPRYIP